MRPLRALVACTGLAAALFGAGPAHATTAKGAIALPCIEPITRYSNLAGTIDTYTLPNGLCAWSVEIPAGGGAFSLRLTNTSSADLDVVFYDRNGMGWESAGGSPPKACSGFSGAIPAQAVLAVVTLTPGCDSSLDVEFNFSF
jgi:hypothetical protein